MFGTFNISERKKTMTNSKLITATILLTAGSAVSGGAVSLTIDNYEAEMAGKNGEFICCC